MSIFTCGLCSIDYDEYTKRPLILPCGHIYCQQCIIKMKIIDTSQGIKCPSDSIIHKIEMNKIPTCAQILSNLPKQSQSSYLIHCIRHPNKKIKFYCRTHDIFPCSICIKEHTDHEIICFEANKSTFYSEMKALINQIETNKETFFHSRITFEKNEKQMIEYYQLQSNALNKHIEHLITYLKETKKKMINELNASYTENKKLFDFNKKNYTKTTDMLIDLGTKMKSIEDFFNKGEYELFYHSKQRIVNDLKMIPVMENANIINTDVFCEYSPGNLNRIGDLIGEIKVKRKNEISNSKRNKTHNSVIELNKSMEDTKSIDSINTMMLFKNDSHNIFAQNLLAVNDKEENVKDKDNIDKSEKEKKKDNLFDDYNKDIRKVITPIRQDKLLSVPISLAKVAKPQSNRDNIQQFIANNPSNKKCNPLYIYPIKNMPLSKHINTIPSLNNIHNSNQNQTAPNNNSSHNINELKQNLKKNGNAKANNKRKELNTEISLDKANKSKTKEKAQDINCIPLFSSPNERNKSLSKEEQTKKNLNNKKKFVNSLMSNANTNTNTNTNSNSNTKNIIKQGYNGSCNKVKKKKKHILEHI